jgi:hypothetical protein
VLFRNYQLQPLGRVEATEHNAAVVVDVCTQTFRLQSSLTALVDAAPWRDQNTLREQLDYVRGAVQALEVVRNRMPRYAQAIPEASRVNGGYRGDTQDLAPAQYQVSAPAAHAARMLAKNFRFLQVAQLQPTERNLAIIVDVCTQVFRIEKEVDRVCSATLWQHPRELQQNLEGLRQALRAIEIVRNRMPSFAPQTRVVIREREKRELQLTKEQTTEVQRLQQLVASARTVEEQQRILNKAGIVHL